MSDWEELARAYRGVGPEVPVHLNPRHVEGLRRVRVAAFDAFLSDEAVVRAGAAIRDGVYPELADQEYVSVIWQERARAALQAAVRAVTEGESEQMSDDPLYHGKPSKKGKRVYCEPCNTWLLTNGNEPDVEIQEHEAEFHE